MDSKIDSLNVTYPIEGGIVTNFEDMTNIWHHTIFNELRVMPSDCLGFILTCPGKNPANEKEQIASIFFESFEVNNFYLANAGVMPLYSVGKSTGLVIDSGAG